MPNVIKGVLSQLESVYSKLLLSQLALKIYRPVDKSLVNAPVIYPKKNFQHIVKQQLPGISVKRNCVVSARRNAVYELSGQVIENSSLTRGQLGRSINAPNNIDRDELERPERISRAIYGGILFPNHYGHLITESTARLWPVLIREKDFSDTAIPILFRVAGSGRSVAPITGSVKHLLECAGIYNRVQIVHKTTQVEELIIPNAANRNASDVFSIFRDLLMTIGKCVVAKSTNEPSKWYAKRVYLSRSRLPGQLRALGNEKELEQVLQNNDFCIVHPQEMGLNDQIAVFTEAEEIVGPLGSAFHTMLLSQNNSMKLRYLIHDDPRDKFSPSRTYQIFDELRHVDSSYIRCLTPHPLSMPGRQNLIIDIERALSGILH